MPTPVRMEFGIVTDVELKKVTVVEDCAFLTLPSALHILLKLSSSKACIEQASEIDIPSM